MLISFKKKQDQKTFSSEKALNKAFGQEQARKIIQRLSEIQAADNLEILRTLPQARAHELTGNRKGQISLDVKQPYRLIILPDHEDCPRKEDGGLKWEKITKVKILGIEDTHE
jgi:plasmid maintenance system killer protein